MKRRISITGFAFVTLGTMLAMAADRGTPAEAKTMLEKAVAHY